MQKIEVDIKKYIDYQMMGEKVTSYSDPLRIEHIKEYNDMITVYCQQTKNLGLCLAFNKDTFIEAFNEYNTNNILKKEN